MRASRREFLRRIAPSTAAALAMFAIMLVASARLRDLLAFSFAYAPPLDALADQLRALPVSFSLWFRPWALSVEHPEPEGTLLLALGIVMLALMAGAGVWSLRRRRLLALALLWPLVMLLPSHSLIARCDLVVEKPLYGAWIGPSLGLGMLLAIGMRASQALPLRALAALVITVFLGTAHWRAWVWADPAALWREATDTAPQSMRAWSNRAVTALRAHHVADARFALKRMQTLDSSGERLYDIELTLNLIAPHDKEVSSQ
jgi:protein O-mannosyl-transferase